MLRFVTIRFCVSLSFVFTFRYLSFLTMFSRVRNERGSPRTPKRTETTPRGKGVTLRSHSRELVCNVREYFERERDNCGPLLPINKVVKRTAAAVKIGEASVVRISKEKFPTDSEMEGRVLVTPGKKRKRSSPITDIDSLKQDAIRQHVYQYYKRKEVPTFKKLLLSIKESGLFDGGRTSLRKLLLSLGFKWKKFSGRRILMERQDIVAWRCRFLRDIIGRNFDDIVWVDETWVNAGHFVPLIWTDDTTAGTMSVPIGKRQSLFLCHAGTVKGFVPNALLLFRSSKKSGDYHEEMTAERFFTWFKDSLLPNISPNSVIVMDNAPYHSQQLEKPPTIVQRKQEIIDWLQSRNVNFPENITKVELLDLVRVHTPQFPKYRVDEIAKSQGHEVLRLPPYHCHFNPIELIWAQIKGYVSINNKTFKLDDVEILVREGMCKIEGSDWKKVVGHTEKIIHQAWKLDGEIDEAIEEIIINPGADSSSSSEELSSENEEDGISEGYRKTFSTAEPSTSTAFFNFEECGVFPLE